MSGSDPGAALTKLIGQLLDLMPDRTAPDDEPFLTQRFICFDCNPDEEDRILALHSDGMWRNLKQTAEYPSGDDGLPFDLDRCQPVAGRRVDLPSGDVVQQILRALALCGTFEIWGKYHERWMQWWAEPDPYNCELVDGCYRFQALTDLYMQQIMGKLPLFEASVEPAPPGVLRVYGAVALELARSTGFPLKMRNKDGAIVDCPLDEAGFLLRRMSDEKQESSVRYWLRNGEYDLFFDLKPA